ncbi:MAG: MGMT family protein [Psychroflexus sp.]|nr:MGMT family protein [Psychroflexus sp.]
MTAKSDFFEKVYAVVREVPAGRVTSYGAIARFLGATRSSRVVGYAMNASHQLDDVPAHRVVNRNGVLTGKHHFSTSDAMQRLLEEENVDVANDQVLRFKQRFWDPADHLNQADFFQD